MNSNSLEARIENLLGSSSSSSAGNFPSQRPPPIPNHEIIAPIGRGSYGEVWLARSVTGTLRAVKVVWRARFSSERPYERELRGIIQFEPISRSHPGVVNVLHVGRDDASGCFFYVMELADGATRVGKWESEKVENESAAAISPAHAPAFSPATYFPRTLASDLKSRGRLPATEAVSLGVQLAGALGHLHRHGLVHRDVKPSNVIFVDGQPKLADIGLVASLNEEHSFVGTEGYIPPEGPGSERADLFSLGRLLYEAATGKNREDFPGLPDDLDRWPANERQGLIELNEVLARACASEAKKRHNNAADLAGDLNLILAGRSVRRAYRIDRRLRRATLISAIALALVIATTFSTWLQHRQRELSEARARRETTLRERAEAAERESQWQLYTALLEQARATVLTGERGHRVHALEAVRRAAGISNSPALRGIAIAALSLPDLRFEREWPTTPDMTFLRLDPMFERIATCRTSGPVEIRAVSDQRLLTTLSASTNRPIYGGRWSPDGRFLAVIRTYDSAGHVNDMEIWDVAKTKRVLLARGLLSGGAFSFHPRLPRIMAGQKPTFAVVWDLESGEEVTRHRLAAEPFALKFAPGGEEFAVVQNPPRQKWMITVHNAKDGGLRATNSFADTVTDLEWHPNGQWIAAPARSGSVYWMDARTGETRELGRHRATAAYTVFTPDGKYLFTGGWDRELICWDAKTLRRVFTVGLDSYKIQFRADGRECVIVHWPELSLQFHAFESPSLGRELVGDIGGGRSHAAFSPDGRWLAVSGEKRLVVWDSTGTQTGTELRRPDTYVGFAPNGELFADRPGECFRWRVQAGTNGAPPILEPLPLFKPTGFTYLLPTSNGVVFTTSRGSKLVGYDQLATEQGDWKPTANGPSRVSPDGRWLALYREFTPHLYVYHLPEFQRVAKLTHPASIDMPQFSPLGDEVAVPGRLGVEFWNTTTWQRTRHLTNATDILYAHDARTFWLWTGYRAAGLYDTRTAELLLPLPSNTIPRALSPDGRRLAATVDARRVQVWDLVEVRERLRELGLDWANQ